MRKFFPLLFGWALALGAQPIVNAAPWIIAHRGASVDAPENTNAAFRLGYEQGADAVECDVHLTADGQVVVLHDASTKRTGGVDWKVAEQSLDALRRLDVGSWKGEAWRAERIPTLAEVLALVPPGRGVVVEIKCGVEILPELERVFADASVPERDILLICFDRDVLVAAKARFPRIKAYWLAWWKTDPATQRNPSVADLAEQAQAAGLDGLNLSYRFPLDADTVAQVHARGLKLGVWTVDDAAMARRLAEIGADAITTNRPAWLRGQLESAPEAAAASDS